MIDISALLKSFIYLISASLFYPVLFLLAALTLLIIIYAGAFFAEWIERMRLRKYAPHELPALLQLLPDDPPSAVLSHRVNHYIKLLCHARTQACDDEVVVENLLQETTLKLWKSMDRYKILVRVGPSLGLIGTLIPMGTGLAALGQGDITRLSTDLVIAFTTTVVGLAIGTCAFFFDTVRRRWIEEDIKNIELATEIVMRASERSENEIFATAAN